MKPRALDLFCCAGGATKGLQRAGFHVTGVDIEAQPRYCGDVFHRADALTFPLDGFDFIWASPPCQSYSDMRSMPSAKSHPALIGPVRARLIAAGVPWVIENVEGAPLTIGQPALFWSESGIVLCGSMFGLSNDHFELRRHRLFESSQPLKQPSCRHLRGRAVVGFYGDHAQIRNRRPGSKDRGTQLDGRRAQSLAADLMKVDWMNWKEVCQAIPPAYSEFIGRQALQAIVLAPRLATSNAATQGRHIGPTS